MSPIKTCTKIEDLVCENCIYGYWIREALICKINAPDDDKIDMAVDANDTCGAGQWYCKLQKSWEDPGHYPETWHRACSKVTAVTSFLDRIREANVEKKPQRDDDYIINALRQIPDLFPEGKSILFWNSRIPPKSVFLTDKVIEFTVRADVEYK